MIEQKLEKNLGNSPTVYTTGAYISPVLIGNSWFWVVTEFEEDSFYEGEEVNLNTESLTIKGLIGG